MLNKIDYLKHYIGCECSIEDPSNLKSGVIYEVSNFTQKVLIKKDTKKWVDARFVKPKLKTFSDLDQDDLNSLLNNIIVNTVKQKASDFNVHQRTENFILLHSEKFNISIRRDWGMLLTGVDGSIASTIDNTATIVFLLCEMKYDVADMFQ